MNNYMYGKAGKADYTVANMPKNRFELFFEVLKVRWSTMFGVNLLYMVFWIPTIAWTMLNVFALASLEDPQAGTVSGLFSTYLMLLIPCVFITGPFTAGLTYVERNWARDQHSFVWSDFWDAVKGNWKQALPVSLISGILPFITYVAYVTYSELGASNSPIFYVPMGLVLLVLIVWRLCEPTLYVMMVTYELRLRDLIRNALIMTVARLPHAIAVKLLTWVFPALMLGVALIMSEYQMIVIFIALLLYVLWIPAFNRLILSSFGNYCCEKYLNTRIEGAATNIGLRPDDWDDTEYIPQDDEEDPPKPKEIV